MATSDFTIPTKVFTKCGQEKLATSEYFNRQRRGKYGLHSQCKSCVSLYNAHPDRKTKRRAYDKTAEAKLKARKRRQTPESKAREIARRPTKRVKEREYNKSPKGIATRKAHKSLPHVREQSREYNRRRRLDPNYVLTLREREKKRRQTPDYKIYNRTKSHNRRAREAKATGKHTVKDVRVQFTSQKGLCWWCGCRLDLNDFHIDHRIPLDRGGSNWPSNICVTCPKCNLSKGKKLPHEWNGRLL